MIVVVSALIGPTETIGVPPSFPGVRYVCYTDRGNAPGWECRPPPLGYPRQSARRAKMTLPDEADYSIWLDASYDLICDPREIVWDAIKTDRDVAAFPHPDRNRIRDEAREVIRCGLAPRDLVERQIEAYRLAGFDTDGRPQKTLTTTGLMVRRHSPAVELLHARWLDELERHTIRDQLSVDYAAWRTGVKIGYLPGHYRENRYARYNRARHRERRVAA